MVWYVMYTFCHWYKNARVLVLFFIVKLQIAEENSKMVYFGHLLKGP